MDIPGPWTLEVLAYFRNDPVINLERNDAPSHALVSAVYIGCSRRETAVVEYALINSPPRPVALPFCGVFEAHAYAAGDDDEPAKELPWFVFEPSLSIESNIDRLRQHVRDAIIQLGRREAMPLASDEPSFAAPLSPSTSGASRFVPQRPPPAPDPPASGPQQPLGATVEIPRAQLEEVTTHRASPSRPPARPPSRPGPARRAPPSRPPQRRSGAPPPEPPPPSPQFAGAPPSSPRPGSQNPAQRPSGIPPQPYPGIAGTARVAPGAPPASSPPNDLLPRAPDPPRRPSAPPPPPPAPPPPFGSPRDEKN